jgi:hypothetical protein
MAKFSSTFMGFLNSVVKDHGPLIPQELLTFVENSISKGYGKPNFYGRVFTVELPKKLDVSPHRTKCIDALVENLQLCGFKQLEHIDDEQMPTGTYYFKGTRAHSCQDSWCQKDGCPYGYLHNPRDASNITLIMCM